MPTADVELAALVKVKPGQLVDAADEPALRGVENCLMSFARRIGVGSVFPGGMISKRVAWFRKINIARQFNLSLISMRHITIVALCFIVWAGLGRPKFAFEARYRSSLILRMHLAI